MVESARNWKLTSGDPETDARVRDELVGRTWPVVRQLDKGMTAAQLFEWKTLPAEHPWREFVSGLDPYEERLVILVAGNICRLVPGGPGLPVSQIVDPQRFDLNSFPGAGGPIRGEFFRAAFQGYGLEG